MNDKEIPNYSPNTRSRVENYLHSIAFDTEVPEYSYNTRSRVENYLNYIARNIGPLTEVQDLPTGEDIKPKKIYHLTETVTHGTTVYEKGIYYYDAEAEEWVNLGTGGGGTAGTLVGHVSEDTTAFPTTRPGGSDLVDGDYVKVASDATLPFTVEGITFNSIRDTAVYLGDTWLLNESIAQNTAETPVANAAQESLSGTANLQSLINRQNKVAIEGIITDLADKLDTTIIATTAPTMESEGQLGQFWVNTTDSMLYVLDEIDDTDPEDTIYTWHAVGGGTITPQALSEIISGTGDITVDVSELGDELLIGTHAKVVTITDVPPTATSGTLTEEQLAALEESTKSVIVFNNEIYFLNDNGHEAGTRGYSHSGVENSKFMLKNITVTLNTRGWVLTTQEVGSGGGAVNSVNGKTGTVVLNAGDILVQNSQTIQANLERIDDELGRIQDEKQDLLTAGTNITIDENNVISSTGGGGGTWGSITGTLSDQTDLQDVLDDKQDVVTVSNHTLYL